MRKMKSIVIVFMSVFSIASAGAQVFSLSIAESRARENYPMIKQRGLIEKTGMLTVSNLSKGYLPQLTAGAQGTYQSDVTKINIPNAPFKVEPLSKDQYKINLDINQLIYDGGMIRNQTEVARLQSSVEDKRLEVEMFKLRERINQLYCSILYMDAMIAQVEMVKTDIGNGIKKVTAQLEGGIAFRSSLNVLKAEDLKTEQRKIELQASRMGMLQVLGVLTDTVLNENCQLEIPVLGEVDPSSMLRPEMELFKSQVALQGKQYDLIRSKGSPKASAFVQGGYGRPGLNMLQNTFDWYGIGGIRFNWMIGNLYTSANEKQMAAIALKSIKLQEETFLKNSSAQVAQQLIEISKLKKLMMTDKEIIALRESVKTAAAAQLEAGVITSNDYLREVNAEDQSRQMLTAHEIQLVQAEIQLKLITGKK